MIQETDKGEIEDLKGSNVSKLNFYIYNERDYLLKLKIQYDGRYIYLLKKRTKWINEKLVYIEWALGRALSHCLIFDVEKEKIIYQGWIREGLNAFQQYQERKKKK